MIGATLTRWLAAALIAVLVSAGHMLDADPEALQDVADDVAAAPIEAQRLARVESAR